MNGSPPNASIVGCLAMLKDHVERNLESGKNRGKSSISNLKSKKMRLQPRRSLLQQTRIQCLELMISHQWMFPPRAQSPPLPQLDNSYQALVNEGPATLTAIEVRIRSILKTKGDRGSRQITFAIFTAGIYHIWVARNTALFKHQIVPATTSIRNIQEQILHQVLFSHSSTQKYSS
ncbi:LOW QUALITY PROTEIN: hypothetical protein Cgig2_028766 [Carnegiea gigantea]|uniref:Uncharacterized protein n=1 Tax=Carnegiea gigantea TaxID=171969 RepID=A0A9Q1JE27_9CARY|nr:LOW QUALITY PROTEIN: hypothetical protein Cgig2_028766 [Carnegiea gigantea]